MAIEAHTAGLQKGERAEQDEKACSANGPQQSVKLPSPTSSRPHSIPSEAAICTCCRSSSPVFLGCFARFRQLHVLIIEFTVGYRVATYD
jgi:hypothetical protein